MFNQEDGGVMSRLELERGVLSEISDIRSTYIRERAVFVDGTRMTEILLALGAAKEDLENIKRVSDRLSSDPTLPFRRTRNGRFCLDFEDRRIYRMSAQPFVLSEEEDFVRHDSGVLRVFDEIEDDLQLNTAFQALLVFKALVVDGISVEPRPRLDYDAGKWVCTVFSIRTVTVPELQGEPALEGVHSDGVDHTMTTFLGCRNTTPDSAVTILLDPAEKNGTRWDASDPSLRLAEHQHKAFLDTLLLVDHERKHSVSPVYAMNEDEAATRDMAIFFTRRPALEEHVSYPYDSLSQHTERPMSIGIPGGSYHGITPPDENVLFTSDEIFPEGQ
ncbi:2OG-Fe dioxygenase family protein [Streptomyces flaveolus]|uniref:2OG-Fe dioxygenase family protein n=1 Tax=Streptomyces flaveolus TaxID=67297 RepID=UPI0034072697